jgi:hypothetical protein
MQAVQRAVANRVLLVLAVIASTVGVVGFTAAAMASPKTGGISGNLSGYTKDQCKNGGWQMFKNANGQPMFKNQGDCVSYFATGGSNPPSNP